jgi:hypothetical protein
MAPRAPALLVDGLKSRAVILEMAATKKAVIGGDDRLFCAKHRLYYSMLYLVSFHFLDLRFVITRAIEDEPRYPWLKPQWLWAERNVLQVGRLGTGRPIPGRDRILPAFSRHATVEGGLILQTRAEFAKHHLMQGIEQDGFRIRNREVVADEWGQVRFDLLIEGTESQMCTTGQKVDSLLGLKMIAPLDQGSEITLADSGVLIARIYEAESLKTSRGYRDKKLRDEAVAATAGTVYIAADPQVILIDLASELTNESSPVTTYDAPGQGTLAVLKLKGEAPVSLCWHLVADSAKAEETEATEAAWSAAFGLSWLIGHVHELAVFYSRVAEYEKTGPHILPDLVRTAIKNRNNQFGAQRFGGWIPSEVVAATMHELWIARGKAVEHLKEIQTFAEDPRDRGGITGNIVRIINIAEKITMSSTTTNIGSISGSNVNIASTLTEVTQSIGGLPKADQSAKEELTKLVAQLNDQLQKLSTEKPDRKDQIEAVAVSTKELMEKAKQDKPNRTLLQVAVDGVKSVAKTLGDVAPAVLSTVTTIAGIIATLHGL